MCGVDGRVAAWRVLSVELAALGRVCVKRRPGTGKM